MSETSTKQPPLSIPRKAVFEGTVRYAGPVVLEGAILGDVHCTTILITERGTLDGTICAQSASIMGEASGAIYAEHVTLKTACSVTADIFHKNLSLENGCYFEGKSRRVANPLSLADGHAQDRFTSDAVVR